MVMHNPPHPGEAIRDLCLEPLGLTVTDAAKGLGVSRKTLNLCVEQNREDYRGLPLFPGIVQGNKIAPSCSTTKNFTPWG